MERRNERGRPLLSSGLAGSMALVRDDRAVALLSAVGAYGRYMMGYEGTGEHICEAGSRPRGLLGFASTHAATIVQTGHHLPGQGPTRRSLPRHDAPRIRADGAECGSIAPDPVHHDAQLPGYCDLGAPSPDPAQELEAPAAQCRCLAHPGQ